MKVVLQVYQTDTEIMMENFTTSATMDSGGVVHKTRLLLHGIADYIMI
jgi:hypothetical protein